MIVKNTIYLDVTPCSPVEVCQHFRGAYCLLFGVRYKVTGMKEAVSRTITPAVLAVYFVPISPLVYSSTLKMEVVSFCETLA
jgi:hypothetical protein